MIVREKATSDETKSVPTLSTTETRSARIDSPSGLTVWERWYQLASLQQRQEFLSQAQAEGLLLAHQLPKPERSSAGMTVAATLSNILAGRLGELPAVPEPLPEIAWQDTHLNDDQRRVVRLAFATPDVLLVPGFAATGKSRVLREIVAQAVLREQRIVVISPDPSGLDHFDECAGQLRDVSLRLPSRSTAEAAPLPNERSLERLLAHFDEKTLPQARDEFSRAEAALVALKRDTDLWPRFDELAQQRPPISTEIAQIEQQIQQLAGSLEVEMNSPEATTRLRRSWEQAQRDAEQLAIKLDARIAELREETPKLNQELATLESDRNQIVNAKQGSKWWSGLFSKTPKIDPAQRLQEIEARLEILRPKAKANETELVAKLTEREQIATTKEKQRQQLLENERQRRQADLDERLKTLREQDEKLCREWQGLCELFVDKSLMPMAVDLAALEAVRKPTLQSLERMEQERLCQRKWLEALEKTRPSLANELLHRAKVVLALAAGTTPEVAAELNRQPPFDLLLVEDSHKITEADLLSWAKLAKRCVLFADAGVDGFVAPAKRSGRGRGTQPIVPWVRLLQRLHPEPRRLPTRWHRSNGKLIATLRPLGHINPEHLHREPVYDRPEIELTIANLGDQDPCIAEVRFPDSMCVADAKAFIKHELQELSIQATAIAPTWSETEGLISVQLSRCEPSGQRVALQEGLLEQLSAPSRNAWGCLTARLDFERTAGWDRAKAEQWVHENLSLRDYGRTALLTHCYRFRPEVARFLVDLLYHDNGSCAQATSEDELPVVQFVAVPSLRGEGKADSRRQDADHRNGSHHAGQHRHKPARIGSGQEIDLGDTRQREALPADLRQALPSRGLVNLPEAKAMIEALEKLVATPRYQAMIDAWQTTHSGPAVAVMSLFEAQCVLLRVLVEQSPTLRARAEIVVDHPERFAHRCCCFALLGLTRSQTNRTVPLSHHPRELILALTRATQSIFLFADHGGLHRRNGWVGPLEHLDESASILEQVIVASLLSRWPEHDLSQRHTRARESSTV